MFSHLSLSLSLSLSVTWRIMFSLFSHLSLCHLARHVLPVLSPLRNLAGQDLPVLSPLSVTWRVMFSLFSTLARRKDCSLCAVSSQSASVSAKEGHAGLSV